MCVAANSLRALFDELDLDGGGTLDREEVSHLANKLGKPLSIEALDSAMSEMDKDGGGEIDFDEFALWYTTSKSELLNMIKARYKIESAEVTNFMDMTVLPPIAELKRWGFSSLDYKIDQMVGLSVLMLTDADLGIVS